MIPVQIPTRTRLVTQEETDALFARMAAVRREYTPETGFLVPAPLQVIPAAASDRTNERCGHDVPWWQYCSECGAWPPRP